MDRMENLERRAWMEGRAEPLLAYLKISVDI